MLKPIVIKPIQKFLKLESAAGIILVVTALLAIILENSPLRSIYEHLLHTQMTFAIGDLDISKALLLWINDGLMAIFFLLVGLEIKRETMEGELSSASKAALPLIAACGGLIFPALIYLFINRHHPELHSGWAIPAATDIAFALGVIMLLGKRIPESLKITLVAIAIIDDLAAIVIIALFYSGSLSLISLGISAICIATLAIFNKLKITKIAPYILVGVVLWVSVLKSGIHATLAGVILAFFIPLNAKNSEGRSPSRSLEHSLHPWVAYMVLPIFAFANAGISLSGMSMDLITSTLTLGIALGLFFGKQLGIMLFSLIAIKSKICAMPNNVNWKQYYGMALVTGIGFTMSLFIGSLAFEDITRITEVRLGIIAGSLFSGIVGYLVLRATTRFC